MLKKFALLTVSFFFLTQGLVVAQTVDFSKPITIPAEPSPSLQPPKNFKSLIQAPGLSTPSIPQFSTDWLSLTVSKPSLDAKTPYPNQVIGGSFTISNNLPFTVYDLKYAVVLTKKSKVAKPSFIPQGIPVALSPYAVSLSDYQISNQSLSILANDSIMEKFSYRVPAVLAGGDYILWIEVIPPRADSFISPEVEIKIQGAQEELFSIPDPYFSQTSSTKTFYSSAGSSPSYDPGVPIRLIYQLENKSDVIPSTRVHLTIKKNNATGLTVKEFDTDVFNFAKGKHSLTITLPQIADPGKYFALLAFNGSVFNNPLFAFAALSKASFSVNGVQDVIKNVFIEKTGPNQERVHVVLGAPLNPVSTLTAALDLNILDTANGQSVFEQTQQVGLSGDSASAANPSIIFDIPSATPQYPSYEITFFKDTRSLDKYVLTPNGQSPQSNIPAAVQTSSPSLWSVVLIVAVIVLVLGGVPIGLYFYFRKEDSSVPPHIPPMTPLVILLAFVISFFAFSQRAEAATWVYLGMSNFPDWSASPDWYSPSPGTYVPGYTLNFSGGGSSKVINNEHIGECPPPYAWLYGAQGAIVVSDGFPSSPSTLNNTNIDSQFANTNYVVRKISGDTLYWYKRSCYIGFQTVVAGSLAVPSSGSKGYFNGLAHAFLLWYGPYWNVGYVNINIDNPQGFNYGISAQDVAIAAGSSGATTISLKLKNGSTSPVAVSLVETPSGVTGSFNPSNTCSPDCNAVLDLSVDPATPPGLYPITVRGDPLNRTAAFTLEIKPGLGKINYFKIGPITGGYTPLEWSVSNFNSCSITDDSGAVIKSGISGNGNGSISVLPTRTTIYTLMCNPGKVKAMVIVSYIKEVIPR